ncbi:MAG: hypothetical protein ACE37K_19295 [Planctomycetota bacterium]
MTQSLIRTTSLLALLAAPAFAQDQLVKQALKKIERVEQALATLPAGDVKAANRLLGDLKWANKRLKGAYKKTTSHWQDANRRLQAADQAVRARAAASGPPSSGKPPASGQPTGKQPASKQPTGKQPTGSQPTGSQPTGNQPTGNQPATEGPVIGADFEKLQQLDKEVRNGFHNLGLLNKSFMGDAYRVGSIQKELTGLRKRLAAFPAGDKNVKIVAANLQRFEDQFTRWREEYAADQAAAGDLGAQLEAIAKKYAHDQLPGALHWPYERDKLTQWAARTAQLLAELPKDAEIVGRARGNAMLRKRANSLYHRVSSALPRRLGEHVQAVRYGCDHAAKDASRVARTLAETDPADRNAVANRVLMPGALERSLRMLNDGLEAVDLAATLDRSFAPEPPVDRKQQRAEIERSIATLRALAKASLAEVRMPAQVGLPAEKVAELTAIAEKVLARDKYGVHPIQRLIVTSKPQRKEKTEGSITGTVTGARVTTYHYVWDEYRVVTAEKVGDETWIFHNTLKFYHSSDSVTPQDVWILSRRFQGTQILADNVAK